MSASLIPLDGLRRFLVRYHHLTDDSGLNSESEWVDYVRKVGCIQYDPLDVVGRNPDLVLQSRSPHYRKGAINRLLYGERRLFDVWDKCMSIAVLDDWACFSRFRRRYFDWLKEHREAVELVTAYLEQHEFACSSDFDLNEQVDWFWGTRRLGWAVLECLYHAGLVVVHHKRGTRRYYALAEKLVPACHFTAADPNAEDAAYCAWQVLRRINSIGLLWNRPGDAWLGIWDFTAARRNAGFAGLLWAGRIAELKVKELKVPLYIDQRNLPLLLECCEEQEGERGEEACRFLAPLDNFIWERKLTAALFDFDYKWEVYTPAAQRQYGYYVLPVLQQGQFIGRAELRLDKEKRLHLDHFWPEPGQKGGRRRLRSGLKRFAAYLEAELA